MQSVAVLHQILLSSSMDIHHTLVNLQGSESSLEKAGVSVGERGHRP